MAASVLKQMWFHSSNDGVQPTIERGLIAATQGIVMPGAPMYRTTSGVWKVATTSNATDSWQGFFSGLVDKSATWPLIAQQDANTAIRVALISTNNLYVVQVENNDSDATVGQGNVGVEYGLRVGSTAGSVGYTTLDLNNSNDTVVVVDIMSNREPSKYTTSDSPGWAVVRFLSSVIEVEKA